MLLEELRQALVKISKDALPWRLTRSTLNVHNRREASLVVSLRDDARIHAPTPEIVIHPLEVIEQITYMLFLKRLNDLHTREENKATRLKKPMERRVYPEGKDPKKRPYEELRWSRFKHFAPAEIYEVVNDHVFPFL